VKNVDIITDNEVKSTYCKDVLDVDCQTQGRLKLMIELYVSEKSVINSKHLISAPSYFSW
jgi:hypothetical protein